MKLRINDIPADGLDVTAEAASDRWLDQVVRTSLGESFPHGHNAHLAIRLVRTCDIVALSGLLEIDLAPACDRCVEVFEKNLAIPLHLNLAPETGSEKAEDADDDVGFSYYQGEEIDLANMIRETLLLEVPFRNLCSESCKGLCPKCGKNLNHAPCSCPSETSTGPFAVLKKLVRP